MRASSPLRSIDEADLDWYFGPGQTLNERSTCGPMLERAELYFVPVLADPDLELARRQRIAQGRYDLPEPGDVTARPRGAAQQSGGHVPAEEAIQRYARVSRRLRAVGAREVGAVAVLESFHGDRGARWGRTGFGRLVAVYPVTEAGVELLRRARRRPGWVDIGLSALEQIGVELEVNRTQPVVWRTTLLERARRQAQASYERASALYDAARRGML